MAKTVADKAEMARAISKAAAKSYGARVTQSKGGEHPMPMADKSTHAMVHPKGGAKGC